ncbi:MAG: thiamine pyrophosphate-dependent enzyme [Succinivibrio sp.]|jgi:pyruvate ferredoxin oxidoreductase beta subunit|nr:thiamine pyrophosphate-dependent enzyme [Succinivibrio sp.]
MLEKIKFYQTGSNTVGNRLLNPSMRAIQASVDRPNGLTSGHRACQGCGEALGARYAIDAAMRATGGQIMVVNATGCLEVFSTPYPESAWRLPWMHSLFGNAAAVGSGLAAAAQIRAQKAGETSVPRVIAQGGDGGTTDIGMGCLSGMFDRNDDVLYICYDNQAYMNTGVQRSSATPPSARTATTMPIGEKPGADWGKGKDVPLIAMAHGIPYVATATVADLRDLEAKVTKAMSFHGARYIQILVPCPLGWGLASNVTVTAARLAIETGFYPIFEAEYGKVTSVRKIRQKQPVTNFLKIQRRYAHLLKKNADPNTVARLQAMCDQNIRDFGLLEGTDPVAVPAAIQAYERAETI